MSRSRHFSFSFSSFSAFSRSSAERLHWYFIWATTSADAIVICNQQLPHVWHNNKVTCNKQCQLRPSLAHFMVEIPLYEMNNAVSHVNICKMSVPFSTSADMSYRQFGTDAEVSWVRTVLGPKCPYTEHTSHISALITDCSVSTWILAMPANVQCLRFKPALPV